MRLKDKVALITGGGSGIGEGIALRFASEGADIVINDINKQNAEVVANKIRKIGIRVKIAIADISKKNEVDKMTKDVISEFKKLDILVNNAGLAKIIPFWEMTEEIWDKILNVNLKGTFLCCLAFVNHMRERFVNNNSGFGKIINISSQSGKTGNTAFAAYCASKFGVIGLTQSLALDLAPYNINVNAICPGIVWTSHWQELKKQYAKKRNIPVEKVKEYLVEKIPMRRTCSIDDVANVAVFLASKESDYMTGQAINITGGQEMH